MPKLLVYGDMGKDGGAPTLPRLIQEVAQVNCLASLSRTFFHARGMGELAANPNPDDCVRVHMYRETSQLSSMWATLPMTFTTTVVWCVLVRKCIWWP